MEVVLFLALEALGSAVSKTFNVAFGADPSFRKLAKKIAIIGDMVADAEEKQVNKQHIRNWVEEVEDVVLDAQDLLDEFLSDILMRKPMLMPRTKFTLGSLVRFSSSMLFRHYSVIEMVDEIKKIAKTLDRMIANKPDEVKESFRGLLEREGVEMEELYEIMEHIPSSQLDHPVPIVDEEWSERRKDDKNRVIELLIPKLVEGEKLRKGAERKKEKGKEKEKEKEKGKGIEKEEEVKGEEEVEEIKEAQKDVDVEEEGSVSVIAIVGVGGVGKTVLAGQVFRDKKVKNYFDATIWIVVSEVFDLRVIVGRIIEYLTGDRPENYNLDQLVSYLRFIITWTRYLLILDDVWNEDVEKWSRLVSILSGGVEGSKILVTTRSLLVANITTKNTKQIYHLVELDDKESWYLFKQVAFRHGQEPEDNITKLGKRIVKMCDGIPLVIYTIGTMLRSKESVAAWSSSVEKLSRITERKELIPPAKKLSRIIERKEPIPPALKLRYYNLKSHLKYCFAYCGVFPKNYEIHVPTLINLWIAQGFIKSSDSNKQIMEDVGYEYFLNLHSIGFFQTIENDENGKITKCKMESLMHDLALSVVGKGCVTLKLHDEGIFPRSRFVSFHFHLDAPWQVPTTFDRAKRVRTILLPNQLGWETEGRPGKSIWGKIVSTCKFLRVLDLHNSGIKKVPKSISKLKHLRYLDVSHNMDIERLPNSITKLHKLHTLKLSFCGRLQGLPRDTRNLVNLRNLEIDGCYSFAGMPLGLGKLTNLRTLSEFVLTEDSSLTTRYCGLDELVNLNNLQGQLMIKNLRHGENYEDANLKEKKDLRSLLLIWDVDVAAPMDGVDCSQGNDPHLKSLEGLEPYTELKELSLSAYGGAEFPHWFLSLEHLVTLSLWRCTTCKYLPSLDQFSFLEKLVLGQLTNLASISKDGNNLLSSTEVLSSLKELQLIELPQLEGWWRDEGVGEEGDDRSLSTGTTIGPIVENQHSFPSLSKLIIQNCPKLKSMPLFPNVKELLELNNSSWKSFQQTMESSSYASSSSSSSSSSPLAELQCLRIVGINEDDMPDGDAISWKVFKSLCSLTLDNLPQLETLPKGLEDIGSLEELHICRCDKLEVIPEWIRDLNSLKRISVRLLPNLTSLPEGMSSTSSPKVEIANCPKIAQNPYPVQDLVKKYLRTSEAYAKENEKKKSANRHERLTYLT